MSVKAIIDLVCKALHKLDFTWEFSLCSTNEAVINGSVMAVCGNKGDGFLIFFYSAVEMPSARNKKYYSMDFGVKRHEGVCHLSRFDAISEAYHAILLVLRTDNSATNKTKNAPEPTTLV